MMADGFHQLVLNGQYTFDNYILGPSNRLAHAASMAICDSPGRVYNPFFVHSAVGLGKTHLLQAVCHRVKERHPGLSICYISCDEFIQRYVSAVQNGTLDAFHGYFRAVDFFVVDDVHFLASRETSQEQFFHTFNLLYNETKQIIMSSDSPPDAIPEIEQRVVSRFKWGLVAEIEPPVFETRLEIVNRRVDSQETLVPVEIRELLAQRVSKNIRELEGALHTVLGRAQLLGRTVDETLVREALPELFRERDVPRITMEDILKAVSHTFQVSVSEIQSQERTKAIAFPRQLAMFLARDMTGYSLAEVGGYLGGRDHTTVLHSVNKIATLLSHDTSIRETVDSLRTAIREGLRR